MNSHNKLAIVFPGQGAQTRGMGLDVLSKYPQLLELVVNAEKATGLPLQDVITQGDERLGQTIYTQPSMLLATVLLLEDVRRELPVVPAAYAGFSLGEYAALYASGIMDFETAFKLIGWRAKAMHQAANQHPGTMAAVMGLGSELVASICKETTTENEPVGPANYNYPGQTVISGSMLGIARASEPLLAAGARRILPLNVSGAFHSSLMKPAKESFIISLQGMEFKEPQVPIFMNRTAKQLCFEELAQNMAEQIDHPVLWEQTVKAFVNEGITCVLEIGPGNVLAGLVRKTDSALEVFSYNKTTDFPLLKGWLEKHELI